MTENLEIEPKTWVLRLNERLDEAIKGSVIGIGWSNARDLEKHENWEEFKAILRTAYPEFYEGRNRALGNGAGSAWQFIFGMNQGDYVVLPAPGGFHVAVVDGDAIFDEGGVCTDFAWKRTVKWITDKPVLRDFASNDLQKCMKAQNTCTRATILIKDIQEAINRKNPLTFYDAVLQGAYKPVLAALHSAINDRGLEKVIRDLVIADGAHAEIPPKNSRMPGDTDVRATYELNIGTGTVPIVFAYQVKQHQGTSGEEGIKQLIDRMEVDTEINKGCFVTTAKEISSEAKEMAESNGDIIVITENGLVEWVLKVGLGALRSH